jgi:hypothetical protein
MPKPPRAAVSARIGRRFMRELAFGRDLFVAHVVPFGDRLDEAIADQSNQQQSGKNMVCGKFMSMTRFPRAF